MNSKKTKREKAQNTKRTRTRTVASRYMQDATRKQRPAKRNIRDVEGGSERPRKVRIVSDAKTGRKKKVSKNEDSAKPTRRTTASTQRKTRTSAGNSRNSTPSKNKTKSSKNSHHAASSQRSKVVKRQRPHQPSSNARIARKASSSNSSRITPSRKPLKDATNSVNKPIPQREASVGKSQLNFVEDAATESKQTDSNEFAKSAEVRRHEHACLQNLIVQLQYLEVQTANVFAAQRKAAHSQLCKMAQALHQARKDLIQKEAKLLRLKERQATRQLVKGEEESSNLDELTKTLETVTNLYQSFVLQLSKTSHVLPLEDVIVEASQFHEQIRNCCAVLDECMSRVGQVPGSVSQSVNNIRENGNSIEMWLKGVESSKSLATDTVFSQRALKSLLMHLSDGLSVLSDDKAATEFEMFDLKERVKGLLKFD